MTETPTAPQSPEEMLENFRDQQKKTAETLRQLEAETARQKELYAFKHHGFWKCMDTKRDKDVLEKILKDKKN